MKKKPFTIALVGNPNSGKSSLFNNLTGLKQKISNFPGTTVEKKTGLLSYQDKRARLVDLPGLYSLFPKSLDETVAVDALLQEDENMTPDLIIGVVDAANLKRNMLLFTQVADLGHPMLLAVNMLDVAEKRGIKVDTESLSRQLGIAVVRINARQNTGTDQLLKMIFGQNLAVQQSYYDTSRSINIDRSKSFSWQVRNYVDGFRKFKSSDKEFEELQEFQSSDTVSRYLLIDRLLKNSLVYNKAHDRRSLTFRLDKVLTHGIWGYLTFFMILFVVFQAIFSWSRVPMDLIEKLFVNISLYLKDALPDGFLSSLLVDGIIPGLSGVLIFIPQIVILFAFIAILEESGYMSRVSFIMDKLMRKFGLNGKSVVPLISGVACAVPAIMAARTIENKRDRLITIFVTPLMSCSARLPVFTLLISLIVPSEKILGILNLQGLVLMGMYLLGFVSALLLALFMKMLIRRREKDYLIMEMPVYKVPRLKSVLQNVSEAAKSFVWNAGKIILAISIVLWFLASYGPGDRFEKIESKYESQVSIGEMSRDEADVKIQSEKLLNSYAGMLGKFIEPAIRPLGFDWKIGIALLSSVAAREVFVGTMSTLYSVGEGDEQFESVKEKMHAEINPNTGQPVFTLPVVLSLLVFYAFALQCISTIAVVRRETNSWKWPLIQFVLMTAMAYFSSLAVYQLLK